MSRKEYEEQFDGPPNPDAIDPSRERLEQELADTKSLLRFQEMHKSAEMLKDKNRMDWLLKNSCIIVNGIYLTSRESLDSEISVMTANEKGQR